MFFGALFSHNVQVAGFAAKQAAIEAGSDASPAEIAVKEWDMPTRNSHPHDPVLAPRWRALVRRTGIEYVGSPGPCNRQVREFQLKTPDSGPDGFVADRAGNISFTATSKATSGSSIREQAKSANTPCLIRVLTTRIRPCSTRKDLFQLRPHSVRRRRSPQHGWDAR